MTELVNTVDSASRRGNINGVVAMLAKDVKIKMSVVQPSTNEEKVLSLTRDQYATITRNVMRRRLAYTLVRKNTRFKIYEGPKAATVTSDIYETLTLKQDTLRGVSSEVAIVSLRGGRLLVTSIESRTRFYWGSHHYEVLTTIPIVVLLGSLICMSCLRRRDYVPISKQSLQGSGKLYLVPLGEFPKSTAEELATFYRTKYGIPAETLPTVHLGPSTMNPEREQLIAEEALDVMRRINQEIRNDPKAILIGLTTEDMYITKYDWQFSFSWREQGKYAVVSTGRMNLGRGRVTEDQIRTRLRKMVTKNVGILYFHLPQSDDPRLREYWFDPRYGVAYLNKEQDTWGIQTYTPPTNGRGNDWVLVLTNVAARIKLPGATQ